MLRRAFVSAAAALAAVSPPAAAGEDLLGLFTDLPAARALGRHALPAMPDGDAAALAMSLAGALERELAGPGPLRNRVAAAARRDFAAGRVACVDGWMLAATEARLCALAALSAGSGPRSASGPGA